MGPGKPQYWLRTAIMTSLKRPLASPKILPEAGGWTGAVHHDQATAMKRSRRGTMLCTVGRRSRHTVLSSYPSVWKREEFGDLLRSGFSHAALPKRTTKIVMWTCTTGLRRSSRRHGGTHSPCWWHEDAPKWVFTRPKRTGLGASWILITWTTTTRRLTTRKPLVQ